MELVKSLDNQISSNMLHIEINACKFCLKGYSVKDTEICEHTNCNWMNVNFINIFWFA